jgi:hypothetical protein
MMQEYTISYYTKTNVVSIKHFKWWEFWKKSQLVNKNNWSRKHLTLSLNEKQKDVLLDSLQDNNSLLFKMAFANWSEIILNPASDLSTEPKLVQVELGSTQTDYIRTNSVKKQL